jgi:hypothetical protein
VFVTTRTTELSVVPLGYCRLKMMMMMTTTTTTVVEEVVVEEEDKEQWQ